MRTTEIAAKRRETLGKTSTKQIRRESRVPGVIYDGDTPIHVTFDYKEAKELLYTPHTYIVKVVIDGEAPIDTIIRESQFHPVNETIQHIDLMKVTSDKEVILTLPIKLTGKAEGVAKGGRLVTKLRRLRVKGIPAEMPETINIDVTNLDLGGTIKVGNADFVEGVKVITPASAAVASVEIPRALRSAKEAASKKEK
jgi:large subunit ribosomal protein L25